LGWCYLTPSGIWGHGETTKTQETGHTPSLGPKVKERGKKFATDVAAPEERLR